MPGPTGVAGGRPGDALTVHHVRAEGSQHEIGRTLAAAAHEVHGRLCAPVPADPTVEQARRAWFALHRPAQLERMRGVAEHFGVDPDDPTLSLDWLTTYAVPAGCSVTVHPGAGTADGHGLLARNFDFPTGTLREMVGMPPLPGERPLAADPWVVETRPDDGYASVTVGIMDVMGAMDGVNEAGLAVALLADNETPEPEPTGRPAVGIAEQQVVRHLLETCADAEEAHRALLLAKHYYFFTPCHFVVADRSGAAFVWEHSPRRNREVAVTADPRLGGRLVCTNHLLHRHPDPAGLPVDEGPFGTAARTYGRWRTLHAALAADGRITREQAKAQLDAVRFEAPLVGGRTFWQALYDLEDASAQVWFYRRDVGGHSEYEAPLRFSARQPAAVAP